MTSQTWKQIITAIVTTIHILPNISTSAGNQTIKFDHLIEYTHYFL